MPNKIVLIEIGLTAAFVGLIGVSALAQKSGSSGQIVPGATGSISPAQGVTPAAAQPPPVMDNALSPETRETLQEVMNSDTPDDIVTVGPGEGAEMDGTTINKISFDSLPNEVKNALGTKAHGILSRGTDQ